MDIWIMWMGSFEFRALIDSTVNPLWVYLVKICQSEIPSMPIAKGSTTRLAGPVLGLNSRQSANENCLTPSPAQQSNLVYYLDKTCSTWLLWCASSTRHRFPCNRLANFNAPAIATGSSRTRGKFKVQNFDVCYSTAWWQLDISPGLLKSV